MEWSNTYGRQSPLGKSTRFDVHLISSPHSCLYTEDAAEVTITQQEDLDGNIIFQGQVVAGNPSFRNSFCWGRSVRYLPRNRNYTIGRKQVGTITQE